MDRGEAVDMTYLAFNRLFNTVSHDSLIRKLGKCGPDKTTERLENCTDKVAIMVSSSRGRLCQVGFQRHLSWDWH